MKKLIRAKILFLSLTMLTAFSMTPAIVSAQSGFSSEGGDWLVFISGGVRGTARLIFSDPMGGVSTITGIGFIEGMGKRFEVQWFPAQQLRIQSNGDIVTDPGSPLRIIDAGGNLLGEFTIGNGQASKNFQAFSLSGTFEGAGTPPVKVSLSGQRFRQVPSLEGDTFEGKISGELRSSRFPLVITEDDALGGYPMLSLTGVGPVNINGVETNDVEINSEFVVTDKGRILGDFVSPVLGEGEITGTLKAGTHGPKLKMNVTVNSPEAYRFTISASIKSAVGPRLGVTPTEETVDFGQTKIETPVEKVFRLTNTGGVVLNGTAEVTGDGADGFTVTIGEEYTISPNKSINVTIQFKPTAAKTYNATVIFTGDETGDIFRNITGVGTP